jgi:transglutaminase/protease-like cytokinesis protein 3
MGCKSGKIQPFEEEDVGKKKKSEGSKDEKIWRADSHRHDPPFDSQPKDEIIEINKLPHYDAHNSQHQITNEIHQNNDTPNKRPTSVDEFVNIVIADPEAFNHAFIEQRQQAITNTSYRSVIESWNPDSLQQLVETIKIFSKGKNLVDRQWIIFYWIAFNIEYDTVSYFSKNYQDQSAEGVFRIRKGVCAGYANIYKYLCDQLQMPCEIVSGYSKRCTN